MRGNVALTLVLAVLLVACIFSVPADASEINAWTTKAPMQVARASLGAAVADGKIYAIGGVVDPPSLVVCTNVNEQYDPVADRWVFKASMPTPRASFGIAAFGSKIYCVGGTTGILEGQYVASGVNEVYNSATDTWSTKTAMPTPRLGVSASVVDGKIYVVGGNSNATEVYDPSTDTWTTKAAMPTAPGLRLIWSCTSAVIDGKIHVFGAFPYSCSHQVYDPATDSWSIDEPLVLGYYLAAASPVSAAGQIHVFGVESTWWDLGPPSFTSATYGGESWRVCSLMTTPRVNVAVAVVDDLVYVLGGSVVMIENNAHPTAFNEQYNPTLEQPVDAQAPQIHVLSPKTGTYPPEVQVDFTVNKPVVMVKFGVDSEKLVAANGNSTLTLQPGSHNLTVYAVDAHGNIGISQTVAFTVKQTQPIPTELILAVASVSAVLAALAFALSKWQKRKLAKA
jgi:hypothetical protein